MRQIRGFLMAGRLRTKLSIVRWGVLWALVLLVVVAFFPAPTASAHALAAGNGRITGRLLNGSKNNSPVAGQSVTLQMAQGEDASDLSSAKTDAKGAFSFTNLATDKTIGYALFIRYQGAQYTSDLISLDSKPAQELNLTVYDATSNSEKVAILQSTVLIQEPDAKRNTFAVSELFSFKNLDTQTFVGSLDASQGKPKALFFSLPQGARAVKLGKGFAGYKAAQSANGFATDAAVPPGNSEFSLSFEVPYTTGTYDFRYTAMYPTVSLTFMAPPSLRTTSGSLTSQGLVSADQHSYRQFKGSVLMANEEVHLALEGLPVARPATGPGGLDMKTIWIVLGILLLLAIVAVSSVIYRRQDEARERKARRKEGASSRSKGQSGKTARKSTSSREEKHAKSAAEERKEELLRDLLALDKSFEAGKISKSVYQERRAKMKARLRTIMSEQEAARR